MAERYAKTVKDPSRHIHSGAINKNVGEHGAKAMAGEGGCEAKLSAMGQDLLQKAARQQKRCLTEGGGRKTWK